MTKNSLVGSLITSAEVESLSLAEEEDELRDVWIDSDLEDYLQTLPVGAYNMVVFIYAQKENE